MGEKPLVRICTDVFIVSVVLFAQFCSQSAFGNQVAVGNEEGHLPVIVSAEKVSRIENYAIKDLQYYLTRILGNNIKRVSKPSEKEFQFVHTVIYIHPVATLNIRYWSTVRYTIISCITH